MRLNRIRSLVGNKGKHFIDRKGLDGLHSESGNITGVLTVAVSPCGPNKYGTLRRTVSKRSVGVRGGSNEQK
jgi:hypothetical protein